MVFHSQRRTQPISLLLIAALAAASMWFYIERILVPYQKADAVAHDRPRGNLSDLYPRWLGTRELLLHHRNPYSDDITREIQRGYYGRELDEARPNDPKDHQAFAYPVYVVFLLAPLIALPFSVLMTIFYWLLAALTTATVLLWLRVLQWRLPPIAIATCFVLTLGSFPAGQGIKLQQLSLLVAAFIAGSAACVSRGFLICGGCLLALATVKPQLAWPMAAWMMVWAASNWKLRRNFVLGFALTMTSLLLGAEIILPGWWRMFAHAVEQYRHYTQNQSVLQILLDQVLGSIANTIAGRIGGQFLAAIAVIACVMVLWKLRKQPEKGFGFSTGITLVLALTVIIVPMYAPYNQILLLPAILLLIRDRAAFLSRRAGHRLAWQVGLLVFGWQWMASLVLAATYWIVSRDWALAGWRWPLFATFASPVWIFALIFLYVKDESLRMQDYTARVSESHE